MHNLVNRARQFAAIAHQGQLRKYTEAPYIEHPEAVAAIVASVTADPCIIAAALLHDVVEDTPIQLDDIDRIFGHRVMELVEQVTDVSRPSDGNRKARKDLDRLHLAKADPDGQTIKLADLIDNIGSIVSHDPGFARVYMAEKRELLAVLTAGHPTLLARATAIVDGYFAKEG
ncbi:MAG: HD domain-containing protein [Desulfobacteraceae bacterium]|nr:HD domain-containing protein [Desulfobacteraceae bacterium]